jgi:hypothetical protein
MPLYDASAEWPPPWNHPPYTPTVYRPGVTSVMRCSSMYLYSSHDSRPEPTRAAMPLYSPWVYSGRNSKCFSQWVQMLIEPAPLERPTKSWPVFLQGD